MTGPEDREEDITTLEATEELPTQLSEAEWK